MKTEFVLEPLNKPSLSAKAFIIGSRPRHRPYVKIEITDHAEDKEMGICIKDKDLEPLAINVLKALKSKRLTKK